MKKIFRTVTALAVVMFAGCTNDITDENVVVPSGNGTTITVGIDDSRTSLGDLEADGSRKVFWQEDDQIAANGTLSTTITLSEDKSSAVFGFEADVAAPYKVYYPGSGYKNETTVTLPASINSSQDDIDAPMAGIGDGESTVLLHHLAAVIRLQIKLPAESTHGAHRINKVEIRGNKGEQMSGDFTIDYENATLTPASTADADKAVASSCGHLLSSEEPHDIFIVVPAQEYAEGFTAHIIDDAGHYMEIKSKATTLAKGQILTMPVIEFVPTGTNIGVEIKSAAELIAFAKAYNAGDYWGIEPFVVHITDDIVFDDTTNAEWEPIGNKFAADNKLGLPEGDSNYFHGYLEGNGHTIKNWKSTRPLFAYTGGGSMIKDLTVDASCTLTAKYADEVEFYGPFVGYHRGSLQGCTNNANITVSGSWANGVRVGGLVGRVVIGNIIECTNNGKITLDDTVISTSESVCAAGITGYISNDDGYVEKCTNNAAISVEGTATAMDCYIGGIVGACNGSIYDCTNTVKGSITSLIAAKTNYVGGISGSTNKNSKILRNTNRGQINYHVNATRDGDDNGRLSYIGGITSCGRGEVSDNANYGSIYSTSSAKMIYIGGIVGIAASDAPVIIKNNTNDKDVVLESSGKGRYIYMGGLLGIDNYEAAAVVRDFSEDTGSILGTIRCNNCEAKAEATYTYVAIGGYIGRAAGDSNVTIKGANEGANIELDMSNVALTASQLSLGGVVGEAEGALAITDCESVNTIHIEASTGIASGIKLMSVGGIVGLVGKGATLTNLTNKGLISWSGANKKSNGKPVYTGGIVGHIKEGNTTITNCHNKAEHILWAYNNNVYSAASLANHSGGIIGCYGWATTEGTITISNCSQEGNLWTSRGSLGGIAGYVRNATIENCSFTSGGIINNGSANIQGLAGSVVAIAANSTISGCTGKVDVAGGTNGSVLYRVGGIAGVLEGTSTIDNCAYFGNITHYNADATKVDYVGGLAGLAENTVIIKNSKFGGTVWGDTIAATNYTDYISNVVTNGGDVYTATIENCSYWDGN